MNRTLLFIFVLIIVSEGLGIWLLDILKIRRKGFAAPIGFTAILAASQLLYYPVQLFNLSFYWIIGITSVIGLFSIIVTIKNSKEVVKAFLHPSTIVVILTAIIFLIVLKNCYIDMEYSDSATYLNYISFNINAPHINLYDLTTGVRGEEWDVYYLFQGYYHFASFICWFINIPYYVLSSSTEIANMVIVVYGLGLLYNVLCTMLILNFIRSFHLKNHWFVFALTIFILFYTNFSYWNISFAFYGNTFRNLFIMESIMVIYDYFKEENEQIKYLLLITVGAGLACSSSFLFMSFAILYSFAAYMFHIKKIRSLFDMTTLITPMVFYVGAFLSRTHTVIAITFVVLYVIFLFIRYRKPTRRIVTRLEEFFFDHAILIFFIIIPAIFALGSLYLVIFEPDGFNNYMYYFNDFVHLDMVKDYIFIHSNWLDDILNVLRWAGVVMIIATAKTKEDRFMHDFSIMMLVFFLNPLCTVMLSKTITGIVFYRNFMTLFNPITEIILFIYFYHFFEWNVIGQWVLELGLCFATLISNYASFHASELGQYWVYVKNGKDVDATYKIDSDEHTAILTLREAINNDDSNDQPIIVSQSGATLTYIPEAYQLFGPRNNYYASVNEDFYEIARRHYDWGEYEEPDYSKTCSYLKEYDVDYVLLQYWENDEFDTASDACTVTFYVGSKYKVKKVE